jgi:hypothetical protein
MYMKMNKNVRQNDTADGWVQQLQNVQNGTTFIAKLPHNTLNRTNLTRTDGIFL